MITKTVIKDYVSRRCPYLAFLELEDKTLVQLLEKSIELRKKYQELVLEAQQESDNQDDEPEEGFDLLEILKDYPHLKKQVQAFDKKQKKNKVELLIEKYNDDQIVSKLSRTYFENLYGKDKCARCDVDGDGNDFVNQAAIVSATQNALKDKNNKVIFEAQIEFNDLRARADVLIRNDDGSFNIIEVKGTNDVFKHPEHHPEIDSEIKDNYLYDMLFQYYVYSHAGMNIRSLAYMYTSRDFEIKKHSYPTADEELNDLFVIKDHINIKDNPMSLIKYFDGDFYHSLSRNKKKEDPDKHLIEPIISTIRDIAKQTDIKPVKDYLCCKRPACPFISMCHGEEAEGPNSVFKLTRWGKFGGFHGRTNQILKSGIDKISDVIPETYGFNELKSNGQRSNAYTQIEYARGNIKESYVIELKKVEEILKKDYMNDDIDYLLFFDFESFQYPIPLVEHVCSWKQVVSQYSMHVVKKGYDLSKHDFEKGKGGDVTHFEFIANPDISKYENPSIDLYKTLKSQLESIGIDPYANNYRVVVFNKSFEQTRMKDFIFDFATIASNDLIRFVTNFRENVVDLLDFFTSGAIYGKEFNGRGSLKVVQPTLADDKDVVAFYKKTLPFDLGYSLDYHKGDKCLVYNGAICLDLYKSLLVRSHLGEENVGDLSTKDLLAEALAYCKIDSWGTVIIYDVIKNVYLGKLKLDAKYI